jgi:ankyrin repeat protein
LKEVTVSDLHTQPVRSLPDAPDLRHLKDQARDLVRATTAQTLSEAQFRIARLYGFPSWPKLKSYIESLGLVGELRAAIDANDLSTVRRLMARYPDLHRARLGYNNNGPLTWVAECRVPRVSPSATRLAMAAWMIENGSDIHQGGDGPLMRAALDDERIPMMDLLVRYGADVNALWNGNYPIVCAPCETLQPAALRWLLERGANPNIVSQQYGSPFAMVVATYARNPTGKHGCLEAFAANGFALPDTAPMALHRGSIDLLEQHLRRDAGLLTRRFTLEEIYPQSLGIAPSDGLHGTPVEGGTLLHLAIEYQERDIAGWLLDHGADVNARSTIIEGYGGHTPLYHAVILSGRKTDEMARLLLDHGADSNVRADLRKQFRHMGDPEREQMREYHNVTPLGYAHQFQEPGMVSEPAVALIVQRGGVE